MCCWVRGKHDGCCRLTIVYRHRISHPMRKARYLSTTCVGNLRRQREAVVSDRCCWATIEFLPQSKNTDHQTGRLRGAGVAPSNVYLDYASGPKPVGHNWTRSRGTSGGRHAHHHQPRPAWPLRPAPGDPGCLPPRALHWPQGLRRNRERCTRCGRSASCHAHRRRRTRRTRLNRPSKGNDVSAPIAQRDTVCRGDRHHAMLHAL